MEWGHSRQVRLEDLRLEVDSPHVELTARKNEAPVYSRITRRTANILTRYLSEYEPIAYIFESKPGKPYWRGWPWWILTQKCGLDVTPTTFRTSIATLWRGDIKDLQLQGGLKTAKTIDDHYKQHQPERHDRDFDRLFESERQPPENDDDIAYG